MDGWMTDTNPPLPSALFVSWPSRYPWGSCLTQFPVPSLSRSSSKTRGSSRALHTQSRGHNPNAVPVLQRLPLAPRVLLPFRGCPCQTAHVQGSSLLNQDLCRTANPLHGAPSPKKWPSGVVSWGSWGSLWGPSKAREWNRREPQAWNLRSPSSAWGLLLTFQKSVIHTCQRTFSRHFLGPTTTRELHEDQKAVCSSLTLSGFSGQCRGSADQTRGLPSLPQDSSLGSASVTTASAPPFPAMHPKCKAHVLHPFQSGCHPHPQ